jgi:SAM-dependent methyltransferase
LGIGELEKVSSGRQFYDSKIHGKYYDPSRRSLVPDRYRAIVEAVKEYAGCSPGVVLEVGSEAPLIPEYWGKQLKIAPDDIRLLEISEVSAELLRRSGFHVDVADVSSERMPFADESISVVIMSEVIEHLADPDFALKEIRRALRRKGLLVLTTPNLACWENRFGLLLGWQPIFTETGTEWVFNRGFFASRARPVGHLHVFTLGALRGLLEFHGFSVLTNHGLRVESENVASRIGRAVDRAASHFPSLASGLLIAASASKSV